MSSIIRLLTHPVGFEGQTAPVWFWLVWLVVIPFVNELVQRSKRTEAQSLWQLFVGLFKRKAKEKGLPVDDKPAVPPAAVLLVLGALSLTACKASPEVRAHMALTAFAEIGSASDHAVTAYDQQLSEDAIDGAKESGSTAEARANLAEWRPKRKLARASIQTYYAGLLGYQLGLQQATKNGGKVDFPALLAGLAKIASRLLDALVKFGVPNLPTLPNFGALFDPVLEPMGKLALRLAEVR